MKKLLFIAMIASQSILSAQEVSADGAQIVAASDAGEELVLEAQEMSAPIGEKFKSAKAQLEDCLKEKKWRRMWDARRKRFIIIEVAEFSSKDPKNDKELLAKREMAAKEAILKAKIKISQWMYSNMSGEEKLHHPGSDINKQFKVELEKVKVALESQRDRVVELLVKVDAAQADALRKISLEERLDDALSAAIKKLDTEYDSEKYGKAAKIRLAKLKGEYEAAVKEYVALCKKATTLNGELLSRQESVVSMMTKMPIFGSTVIRQAESWNDKTGLYQVAVMLTWSKKLERAARAIALGEKFDVEPGKKTVEEWLDAQNLAMMVGPRKYVDDCGDTWFLGVTARSYSDSLTSFKRQNNRDLAEMFAQQMAVFCVYADVESQKIARQRADKIGDEKNNIDVVAESFSQMLKQSFSNKTIRGMQELASKEVVHPISGEEMYVVVYGLNASDASAALEAEKINFATRIQSNRYQSIESGRRFANEAAVKASEDRLDDVESGANAQVKSLGGELKSRNPNKKKGRVYLNPNQGKTEIPQPKKNTSGVFMGDTDVIDDF